MSVARLEKSPTEVPRSKRVFYVWTQVGGLIAELGGSTHIELVLERGARQIIRGSSLRDEATDFLLDVIDDDKLAITLHISEKNETPYYEVFTGRCRSLRGLQCYGFPDRDVSNVSPRQTFDPTTVAPINPEPTGRLNRLLNQDEEIPFNITEGLLEFTKQLIADRPQGLSIVAS